MRSGYPDTLVDTNVLIYAVDPRDPAKGSRALGVLEALEASRCGAVSAQVLGEFYVNVQRLASPLTAAEAADLARYYAQFWRVLHLDTATVLRAVGAVTAHHLSYWDALIWATARENGIRFILSEGFQDGLQLEGVLVRNPLTAEFSLTDLLP